MRRLPPTGLALRRRKSSAAVTALAVFVALVATVAPVTSASGATVAFVPGTSVSAAPAVIAADSFARKVTSGWGTADGGGAWTTAGAAHAVAAGQARQVVKTPGQTSSAFLGATSSTSTDLSLDVQLDKPATGGGVYLSVLGRKVGTAGDYRARLKVQSTGQVALIAARGETALKTITVPGVTYAAGMKLSVRLQVTGTAPTTIRAKTWQAGTTEPSEWQVSTTDTTAALQQAGAIGVATYVSSSATNAPITMTCFNIIASGAAVNVSPLASAQATVDGLAASFDSSASVDPDGTIIARAWSFGDGSTGTGVGSSHAYAVAGTYTVSLMVTDNAGATNTATAVVKAVKPNVAPVARVAVSGRDLVVTADGAGSSDADGVVASYAWKFGDGSTATGVGASHTYAVAGTYTVSLTVTDNAGATSTATAAVTAVKPVATLVKPGASNTGVPAGTTLTEHRGDLVITTPGTVIDGLDIYGFVTIKAANVTIKNSRVRGSGPGTFNTGLINCNSALVKGAVIQDVLLVPDFPSIWLNGVIGHDFTALRVNTYNVVDGFGVYNTSGTAANVTIQSSYVHELSYFSPDPNHSDNATHNDAIQIQGGSNISIVGNYLSAWLSKSVGTQTYKYPQAGFGVILTPNVNAVTASKIEKNWIDGSYIPIKLTTGTKGPMNFGQVNGNRFARDMRNTPMLGVNQWFTILLSPDLTAETINNVYDDGSPVTVRRDSGTATAP